MQRVCVTPFVTQHHTTVFLCTCDSIKFPLISEYLKKTETLLIVSVFRPAKWEADRPMLISFYRMRHYLHLGTQTTGKLLKKVVGDERDWQNLFESSE